jgi:hypothetical protein
MIYRWILHVIYSVFLQNGHDNKIYLRNLHIDLEKYFIYTILTKKYKYYDCMIDYDQYFFYINFGHKLRYFYRLFIFDFTKIPKIPKNIEPYDKELIKNILNNFYKCYGTYNYVYNKMKSNAIHIHNYILNRQKCGFCIKCNDKIYIVYSLYPIKNIKKISNSFSYFV